MPSKLQFSILLAILAIAPAAMGQGMAVTNLAAARAHHAEEVQRLNGLLAQESRTQGYNAWNTNFFAALSCTVLTELSPQGQIICQPGIPRSSGNQHFDRATIAAAKAAASFAPPTGLSYGLYKEINLKFDAARLNNDTHVSINYKITRKDMDAIHGLKMLEGNNKVRYLHGIYLIQESLNEHSPFSYYAIGYAYYYGKGVPENKREACEWFSRSAKLGVPQGQFADAYYCEFHGDGIGYSYPIINKDILGSYLVGLRNIESSAKQGYSPSYDLLCRAWSNLVIFNKRSTGTPDYVPNYYTKSAIHWCSVAARNGQQTGNVELFRAYFRGYGVNQNYQKALHYLTVAEKHDDPIAMSILGIMYLHGYGVPKNPKKSFILWRKSAYDGFPISTKFVWLSYKDGIGVKKNIDNEYVWKVIHAKMEYPTTFTYWNVLGGKTMFIPVPVTKMLQKIAETKYLGIEEKRKTFNWYYD